MYIINATQLDRRVASQYVEMEKKEKQDRSLIDQLIRSE
jgi:hypothetical protein